jgi:hypothetical protein
MSQTLYDGDILLWSERTADTLRRLAAGERVNETVDWPNVIEEIEAVGRSELHACASLLRQAMVHLLKLALWPDSQAAAHWRGETVGFLADARRAFSPSMRQRLDVPGLYRDALRQLCAEAGMAEPPARIAEHCPFEVDDLLAADGDVAALAGKLAAPATS